MTATPAQETEAKRVLVLGAYGLIGSAISRKLASEGYKVIGLGRSAAKGQRLLPELEWLEADIANLQSPYAWAPLLKGVDHVVNAAGVLQDGYKDNVSATQTGAMIALMRACETEGVEKFVQISTPGANANSDTDFYRSKALADDFLKTSKLNWTIFRPGLVLSPQAYGGSSLLRMLASFPLIQPLMMGDTLIQTVHIDDVSNAVHASLSREELRGDFDLCEHYGHSLENLILKIRHWLGFTEPVSVLKLPMWFGKIISTFADFAGWLGWRSALRSNAIKVLGSNVTGNASPWEEKSGFSLKPLEATLATMPATAQERLYARAQLAFPALVLGLSLFWSVSGVIGLVKADAAISVFEGRISETLSSLFVYGGSLIDIAIGAGLLIRPWLLRSCMAAIVTSLSYMLGSVLITPELWLDPLGPMIKVIPATILCLAVMALVKEG